MKSTSSNPDPIKTYKRKQTAARRVGKNDRCVCGEARAEALIGSSGICAACKRKTKGHSVTDNHHVAGSANGPVTVAVPVNDHRAILSPAQYDWPKKTLENLTGDPLRAAAACIRGFIDIMRYLCESLLEWIAEMVERLSEYLIERNGPEWWIGTPLEQFASKGKNNVTDLIIANRSPRLSRNSMFNRRESTKRCASETMATTRGNARFRYGNDN